MLLSNTTQSLYVRFADGYVETIQGAAEDLMDVIKDFALPEILSPDINPIPNYLKIVEHHITSHNDLTIAPEKYTFEKTEEPVKHSKINYYDLNNIHPLTIYNHTRITCAETGITYLISLPTPFDTEFRLVHPFAEFDNVRKFIRKYQRHGLPLGKIDHSTLAGLIITILRHKGYAADCKDWVVCNLRLQKINRKTLIFSLGFFFRLPDNFHNPRINLSEDIDPTGQILSYMKILRGEDESVQILHYKEKQERKFSARVYQTEDDKEAAMLRESIKSCRTLLDKLRKNHPEVLPETYETLGKSIAKLGWLPDEGKEKLINEFTITFGECDETIAISRIIQAHETSAIARELLTFSQEIEKAENQIVPAKDLDFKTLMGWK